MMCLTRLIRRKNTKYNHVIEVGLAIAKLKPLSLFISLFLMLKKAFDNVKIEK